MSGQSVSCTFVAIENKVSLITVIYIMLEVDNNMHMHILQKVKVLRSTLGCQSVT